MKDAYNRDAAEIEADWVMDVIEWLTVRCCVDEVTEFLCTLNHLTQLHKFRDIQFCDSICRRWDRALTREQYDLIEAMQTY